jgi:peptidoglycan hydrolase-like protein with peptidoglycan-binding domain
MESMRAMSRLTHGKLAKLGVTTAAVAAIAVAGSVSASAAVGKPAAAGRPAAVTAAASVSGTAQAAVPAGYTAPTRNLTEGMRGADVKALQQRLAALKYYPGAIDSYFGSATLEAVWAFQEVNRLSVDGVVGPAMKRALVHPRAYRAKYPGQAGTRVEVNLGMGVLVFFRNHNIALVSHVSTGGHYFYDCNSNGCAYAETPTGKFRALYLVKGWDQGPLGAMYNPVFFNYSGYAIHGEPNSEVPVKPVSHGCVRIPYDIATWFYKDLTISQKPGKGTEVLIYNQWH